MVEVKVEVSFQKFGPALESSSQDAGGGGGFRRVGFGVVGRLKGVGGSGRGRMPLQQLATGECLLQVQQRCVVVLLQASCAVGPYCCTPFPGTASAEAHIRPALTASARPVPTAFGDPLPYGMYGRSRTLICSRLDSQHRNPASNGGGLGWQACDQQPQAHSSRSRLLAGTKKSFGVTQPAPAPSGNTER